MFKKIGFITLPVVAIFSASLANAAYFDFQAWTGTYGEQGFDNSTPFSLTEDGLTLTATATEQIGPDIVDSHVYMDGFYLSSIGGMGVCSAINTSAQCIDSSDDNVSIDSGNAEILSWNLSQNITDVTLGLGDTDHYDYNGNILYRYGGGAWIEASDASNDGYLTLTLDGSSNMIEFMAVGESFNDHFYIRNADITAVPVPAAVWLFASGLLGLVAVSRRRV